MKLGKIQRKKCGWYIKVAEKRIGGVLGSKDMKYG